MEFEFDARKSKQNKEKHGIDFVEAQRIWEDAERIEIPARTEDELRYVVIGRIEDRCWSQSLLTETIGVRIISVRRSGQRR